MNQSATGDTAPTSVPVSSIGLSSRTATLLAYSGWWITGVIFWALERRDPVVRFHAAQSVVVFGVVAAVIVAFGMLAAASLSFMPSLFITFIGAAVLTWIAGVVLWGVVMWRIGRGGEWRIPAALDLTVRLARF